MTNFCHDFPSLQVAKHDEIEKKKTGRTTYVHAFKKKGHYDYPRGLYFSMKRNYGKIGYKILLKYGAMTVVYNVRRLNHCYCMSRWVFCDPVFFASFRADHQTLLLQWNTSRSETKRKKVHTVREKFHANFWQTWWQETKVFSKEKKESWTSCKSIGSTQ